MIRDKAIFIKLINLNLSDQQLYDSAVSDFSPSACTCPSCNAKGRFKQIHPYERHMISVNNGVRTDTLLSVHRFLCESCGHTHALLPDILIPFGSFSLRFVLIVLEGYLSRPGSVADYCESRQIAVSTLYGWIHLFASHYNAWCQILDRIAWICNDAIKAVSLFPAFPAVFLARFGFSFLQAAKPSPSVRGQFPDRRRRPSSA